MLRFVFYVPQMLIMFFDAMALALIWSWQTKGSFNRRKKIGKRHNREPPIQSIIQFVQFLWKKKWTCSVIIWFENGHLIALIRNHKNQMKTPFVLTMCTCYIKWPNQINCTWILPSSIRLFVACHKMNNYYGSLRSAKANVKWT